MSPLSLSLPVRVADTRVKLSSLALSLKAIPEIDARVGALLAGLVLISVSVSVSDDSLLSVSPLGLFRSSTASSTLISFCFSSSVRESSSSSRASSGRLPPVVLPVVSSALSSSARSSSARFAARTSCPCGSDSALSAAPSGFSSSIMPKARITTLSNSDRPFSASSAGAGSVTAAAS